MRLIRRLFLLFLAVGALLVWSVHTLVEANTIAPETQFKFEPLVAFDTYKLDIAPETKHTAVDVDGDTLVGAVIRLTPTEPMTGEKPDQLIGTFINAVIAVCGRDDIILVQSNMFDPTGKEIAVVQIMKPMPVGTPFTPTDVIYKHLCAGVTKRDRNNSTWA